MLDRRNISEPVSPVTKVIAHGTIGAEVKTMTRVEELADKVQRLSRQELAAFREWFREYDSDEWDREIEEDVLAGRLDTLADKAIAEHKAGRTKEL